ncbi:exo-alpha-sialidase [Fulvivirga sp. RKSG066]|uniref:exo-alpha-sialidase n=1 Tax=Fulvivirga aurantia TaxID=2529383 RepID=UPI0012BD56F4|nr:exo-alpha-sialidase [Fulvivirga aurantia]MTI22779.1 exo-alpha-sialidase [Fulvivirga aurantia]
MRKLLLSLAVLVGLSACDHATNDQKNESDQSSVNQHGEITKGVAPYLFKDFNDNVYLSWTEQNDSINELQFSVLSQDNWTEPKTIAKGTDWFINWADYPILATKTGKNFIAHYLQKSSKGTYSYDVMLKQSTDSGATWVEPRILHDDGKQAEHGFVSIAPYNDNFFVSWLDGRNTVSQKKTDHAHHGSSGAMTLRAAVITPSGEKLKEWELDNRVCDCCQTTAVITNNGPVVAYRDRSSKEIRDISITRLIDAKWSSPQTIHDDAWKIAGCPVNGPRMSAKENALAVAWFTVQDGEGKVKMKFSTDSGETFGPEIIINQQTAIGRVDVELLDDQSALVSWMEGSEIMAARINPDGEIIARYTIATSSENRGSGFPQMTVAKNKAIFTWTDSEKKTIQWASLNFKN